MANNNVSTVIRIHIGLIVFTLNCNQIALSFQLQYSYSHFGNIIVDGSDKMLNKIEVCNELLLGESKLGQISVLCFASTVVIPVQIYLLKSSKHMITMIIFMSILISLIAFISWRGTSFEMLAGVTFRT